MGFFEGLNAEKYDRQYSDRQLLRRIGDYFKPQAGRLAGVDAAGDRHRRHLRRPGPCSSAGWWICWQRQPTLQLIGAGRRWCWSSSAFLQWGLNWARRSLIVRAVGDVVLQLRARAFEAAAEHDLSFYDQFSSGPHRLAHHLRQQ